MKTPESDALINRLFAETKHVGPHNCPENWVVLCRKLEMERDQWRGIAEELARSLTHAAPFTDPVTMEGSGAYDALKRFDEAVLK